SGVCRGTWAAPGTTGAGQRTMDPGRTKPQAPCTKDLRLVIANLAHVGRERLERDELARMRTFERQFEIRQERVVGRHVRLVGAARGDWCARRTRVGAADH